MSTQTITSNGNKDSPKLTARKHWGTIRRIATREEDEEDATQILTGKSITHGIYKTATLVSQTGIASVTHNLHSGQYLILFEDGNVEVFLKDGSREKVQPQELFNGIIYASKAKLYVTWNDKNLMQLLTQKFDLISSAPSSGNINCTIYNEFKNEVISASSGSVTVWSFRMNNTLLVPKLTITDKLDKNDEVTIVVAEPTSSKGQRLFVAIKNGLKVFRLSDGHCIAQMPDLHKRAITDMLFYQPLQVIMTAAADGSIKLWDNSCNLRSVFIGHTNAVTCLSSFQKGPLVLSGSRDGSLRLWNVDTNEEVECVEAEQPINGMCRRFGEEDFFTFTSSSLVFWKINNVYKIFTVIGSKAKIMKTTTHPGVPPLSYYICEDACVRMTCPKNGNVITTMLSPQSKRIIDAVYAVAEGVLLVLLRDGMIMKCSAKTNPCTIEEGWNTDKNGAGSKCTAFCLFEHVLQEKLVGDRWKDLVTQKQFENASQAVESASNEKINKERDRTLLIGGCENGKLVVLNWTGLRNKGKVSFSIEAHRGSIVSLASNTTMNQIASCSSDKTIRIWRVFPFAEDALAPMMFILNNEPATHLVYSKHRLCVVLQDPSTATFNVTMFKTTDTEPVRIEHGADDDHLDTITALCCCSKLNIFASASADGTIRIWDEQNRNVRIIKLHIKPSSLCFCSQRGDLLVGIGEHVSRIPYKRYLPEKLIRRMVAVRFNDSRGIKSIEIDKSVLEKLDVDQKHRLLKARSSDSLLAKFVDIIPFDELEERKLEEKERNMAVSILKKRDDDLTKLRDGEIAARKKPAPSETVREEAWRKYLDIFYNRSSVPVIDNNLMDDEDEEQYTPYEARDSYKPDRNNTGFFSISTEPSDIKKMATKLKELDTEKKETNNCKTENERSLSWSSEFGSRNREMTRPLSVGLRPDIHERSQLVLLRRILSAPPKFKSFKNLTDIKKGSDAVEVGTRIIEVPLAPDFPSNFETLRNLNRSITDRQKTFNENRKARGMLPVAPDGYLPNSIIVALYKELKKEEKVEEKEWKPKQLTEKQLEELETFKKRKKKFTVEEKPDEEPVKVNEVRSSIFEQFKLLSESPSSEKELDLETPPPTPPKSPTPEPTPEPPAQEQPKVVKPLKPIEKLVSRPVVKRTPTPPREPSPPPPPRPVTPLPGFIVQFKGQEWFEKLFPNATPELFPKPWTIVGFVQLLLDCLKKEQNFDIKTQICAAILILHRQHPFNTETVNLVQNALIVQLNIPLEPSTDDSESKNRFIKLSLTTLASLSIHDVQFILELMAQYITADFETRHHAIQIFHEIGLQDPHSYFTRELETFTTYGIFDKVHKKQAIKDQCKDWLEKWMQLFSEHIASLAGKIYRAKKGNVVRGTKNPKTNTKGILKKNKKESAYDSSGRKITFMPNDFISDAAKNVMPIDAINYFCEMEYQNELERARNATAAPSEETTKSDRLRNTVVILPKIDGYRSLARLGETHQSCCHPERETALAYDPMLRFNHPVDTDEQY
ncbi:WD repeat-containing protein 97-like isoform X2 [Rhopilema esculentum]|uniref:WD repeat-containing protein 97-like isoform X2 n=1 Tax=Rhopilema esculentum TaxID=499914 RepID=UPI0031DFF6D2